MFCCLFLLFSKVDENGVITESKFKTFGCGSAIASSSVATEWLKGRSVDESLKIKNTDIAGHLKLPPVKLHCRYNQPLFFEYCTISSSEAAATIKTSTAAFGTAFWLRIGLVRFKHKSVFFSLFFEKCQSTCNLYCSCGTSVGEGRCRCGCLFSVGSGRRRSILAFF